MGTADHILVIGTQAAATAAQPSGLASVSRGSWQEVKPPTTGSAQSSAQANASGWTEVKHAAPQQVAPSASGAQVLDQSTPAAVPQQTSARASSLAQENQ